MSKGDRDQLAGIVKMRARLAKSAVAQREAELLADFESQLATRVDQRAEAWADATAIAEAAVVDVAARGAFCDASRERSAGFGVGD